jgi:hypothetical protein
LYKSELTLPSEVRRQVAAKKVETLLDLYRAALRLLRTAQGSNWTEPDLRCQTAFDDYMTALNFAEVFFAPAIAEKLQGFGVAAHRASSEFERAISALRPGEGMVGAPMLEALEGDFKAVLAIVKEELQLADRVR